MDKNGGVTGRISGKDVLSDLPNNNNSNANTSSKDDGGDSFSFSVAPNDQSPDIIKTNNVKRETSICDLPRQVWLDIYEHIDYSTYLNLRLTSNHFLRIIDEYIGFRVVFNKFCEDNANAFNFFSSVALNDVQFEDAEDPVKFDFCKLFKYPNFLTDVSFVGPTNYNLVKNILLNCHCLQLVEMTMDCKVVRGSELDLESAKNILPGIDLTSRTPPKKAYLRQVETLKLVPGVHNDNNLRSHVVLSILRGTKAGNCLKKVIFQCELSPEITLMNVLMITAELLENHPKLEALFLALLNDEYLLNSEESNERGYTQYMDLENEAQVEHYRTRINATGRYLKIKKMGLAMLNPNMQLIWTDFLKTQHRLVHLSLTVTIDNGTFTEEFFNSFSATLEQLAIRGKFEVEFDFQHLSNCSKLKEICLHNLQENGGGGIIPKCVNLPEVTESLESLILFQVVARTEEIRQALRKLTKLTTLVLFKCGHAAGETGIGLHCLQDILHKRSLESILMVQFICQSTSEAETLAGILYDLSLHVDNQANQIMRRNRRPVGMEVHEGLDNELNLPDVVEGRDVLLFPLGAADEEVGRGEAGLDDAPPEEEILQRPVSRGNHRMVDEDNYDSEHSESPNQEEFDLQDEGDFPHLNDSQSQPVVDHQEEARMNYEEAGGIEIEVNEIEISIENNNADDNNRDVNNNENNEAFNIINNILEHAMVANPDQNQGQRQINPNLENQEVELILDVDDADLGPVLDLFAAEQLAREHNVQVGFILDGVIDIMNEEVIRSKWLCVEDGEGHITYTLKISVEL